MMLEARRETCCPQPPSESTGIAEHRGTGFADAAFPDRAWTLPHRVDLANTLTIAAPDRDDIVITHVMRKKPGHGMTEPQAKAEAYSARVYLDEFDRCDVWCDERPFSSPALPAGAMLINDMRHAWRANPISPFDAVNFFLPQSALDRFAEGQGQAKGMALRCPSDAGWTDNVFKNLALSLLPALAAPEQTNALFNEHIATAAIAHLAANYGSFPALPRRTRSGLAPWQERRAKEMLIENLGGDISIAELATACRLSPGHFSQSFRRSVGCPPHKWLLKQRVERAKHLMLTTAQPLCEIALDIGFADQSHLTRVFSQHLGASPAAWRRAQAA
jgi:AraC family transcriptional regulator